MTDVQIQDIKSFIQQRAPHDSISGSAEPVIQYMNGYLLENVMQIPRFLEFIKQDGLITQDVSSGALLEKIADIYEYTIRNNIIQFRVLLIGDLCIISQDQLNERLRRPSGGLEICIVCRVLGTQQLHPIPLRFVPQALNLYLFENQHLKQNKLENLITIIQNLEDKNTCRLNMNDIDHLFENLGTYLKRQIIQSHVYKEYIKYKQKLPEIIQQDNFIYLLTINSISYIKDLIQINNAKMKTFVEQLQSYLANNYINVTVHNQEFEFSYNKVQSQLQRVIKELQNVQKDLMQSCKTMQYLYQ